MGIEIEEFKPLTSPRALIKIADTKVQDSPYPDSRGREQIAIVCELEVVKGAGKRDGEGFREFLNIPYEGETNLKLRPNTKAGQVIFSALEGRIDPDDDADELAAKLKGKHFVSAIGTSKNGEHSRIVHDTISPAPAPARKPEPPEDEDDDFSDLTF